MPASNPTDTVSKRLSLYVKPHTIVTDCPVCGFALRYKEDVTDYRTHGACADCVRDYYYTNLDEWNKGWRPVLKERDI